jgi:hypothetical protein
MRSPGGTNCGEPFSVTFSTNLTIACFGAVSFHEGSGSLWAFARRIALTQIKTAANIALSVALMNVGRRKFMVDLLSCVWGLSDFGSFGFAGPPQSDRGGPVC